MLAKLKLYLLPLFILSSFVAIFVGISKAADQTITCNSSGCSGAGTALFSESNAVPGGSATKSLAIKNERSKDLSVTLSGTKQSPTDDILLDVVDVDIKNADDSPITSVTLATFLSGSPISLGSISAGASKEIKIGLSFRSSAGNDYQDKKATFDILVSVRGDDEPSVGGASTTTSTGGGGGGTPAVFGAATKAFGAKLLGVSAEAGVQGKETGVVEGLACSDNYYRWWLPLLIQAFLTGLFTKIIKGRKGSLASIFILAIVSQLISEFVLRCNCATGIWCPRYWVFNLLVLIISLLFWRFLRKRKHS